MIGFCLLLAGRTRKQFNLNDNDVFFYRGCICAACNWYVAHLDLATAAGLRMGSP